MKTILTGISLILCFTLNSCAQINFGKELNKVKDDISKNNNNSGLTNEEVIAGLKEALTVGTNNSSSNASKEDGFYKNPEIKIPFPKDAEKVKETVESLGMQKQVEEFVLSLNRAAEEAAKESAPIFIDAVKTMTITDGFNILKSSDNAATQYLQDKTTAQLKEKFQPKVHEAIQKVNVTKYWTPLITRYNTATQLTGGEKINPDLDAYVTEKAIEGLFKLIAGEELKIRKDPAARVTDLLKKVFGE